MELVLRNVPRGDALTPLLAQRLVRVRVRVRARARVRIRARARARARARLLAQRLLVLPVPPLRCLLLSEHIEHVLLRRKGLQARLFGHTVSTLPV